MRPILPIWPGVWTQPRPLSLRIWSRYFSVIPVPSSYACLQQQQQQWDFSGRALNRVTACGGCNRYTHRTGRFKMAHVTVFFREDRINCCDRPRALELYTCKPRAGLAVRVVPAVSGLYSYASRLRTRRELVHLSVPEVLCGICTSYRFSNNLVTADTRQQKRWIRRRTGINEACRMRIYYFPQHAPS